MYEIIATSRFKTDLKGIIKRGYDVTLLDNIVSLLMEGKVIPVNNKDLALSGSWAGYRECHITSDWLLVYKIDNNLLVLTLTRTGTHSDLF